MLEITPTEQARVKRRVMAEIGPRLEAPMAMDADPVFRAAVIGHDDHIANLVDLAALGSVNRAPCGRPRNHADEIANALAERDAEAGR